MLRGARRGSKNNRSKERGVRRRIAMQRISNQREDQRGIFFFFLRCCSEMSGRYNRSAPSVAKSSNNCFTYSLQDTLLMHARAVIFIYFLFLQKEVRLHFDLLNSLKGEGEAERRKKRACWCRVRRELESQLEKIDARG